MTPAGAAYAQAADRKLRLIAIEMVHGAAGSTTYGARMNMWAPAATGSAFDLAPTAMASLEPYRDALTIISNTDCRNAEAFTAPEIGADHFRSAALFLTQGKPKQTQGSDVLAGTSLNQIIAGQFGQDSPIPSMQLCIENVDLGRRLLLQLLVRLRRHNRLGLAVRAPADDPRPHGVQSALRGGHHAGGPAGAAPRRWRHPGFGHRVGRRPPGPARHRQSGPSGRLPRRRP